MPAVLAACDVLGIADIQLGRYCEHWELERHPRDYVLGRFACHVANESNVVIACVSLEVDSNGSVKPEPDKVSLLLVDEAQFVSKGLPFWAQREALAVDGRVVSADVGSRLAQ